LGSGPVAKATAAEEPTTCVRRSFFRDAVTPPPLSPLISIALCSFIFGAHKTSCVYVTACMHAFQIRRRVRAGRVWAWVWSGLTDGWPSATFARPQKKGAYGTAARRAPFSSRRPALTLPSLCCDRRRPKSPVSACGSPIPPSSPPSTPLSAPSTFFAHWRRGAGCFPPSP
jgi:hypothetical protein